VVPGDRRDAAPREYRRSLSQVNAAQSCCGRILISLAPGRSDRLAGRARRQLGRIDPRSDRPHGLVRLGVAVCVALTLALGLVYFVKAVDRLRTDARANAASSFDDRQFGGAHRLDAGGFGLLAGAFGHLAHGEVMGVGGFGDLGIRLHPAQMEQHGLGLAHLGGDLAVADRLACLFLQSIHLACELADHVLDAGEVGLGRL